MSRQKLPRCVGHDEMGCIIVADKQTLEEVAKAKYREPNAQRRQAAKWGASYALDGEVSDEVVQAASKALVANVTRTNAPSPDESMKLVITAAFAAIKKELGI